MVQVTVKEGLLEGELTENEYGRNFYSFRGIPYAEPPVGDLRFKPPQPKKPWEGVRDAKEFGSISYQIDMHDPLSPPTGSEDCLFLNVYTPEINPTEPLPVIFYIHGGGFVNGSGNDSMYGAEFLVRHGVILVTFNYRLEVLGFLCLDTREIPGNAGIKDQVMALKWVNENISRFGGDPKNITIMGHSAGGCSVSYHLISPMTKGLFKRAVVKSGSFNCPWGRIFEPRERALALARKLGCYSTDNKELYEFFKSQPIESLITIQVYITLSEKAVGEYETVFGPVDEKDFGNMERFIYGDLTERLRNGIHEGVELLMGYTEDEGLINVRSGLPLQKLCDYVNEYREYFVPRPIAYNCPLKVQFEVGRKVKEFYYKNNVATMDNMLSGLVRFYSMNKFVYPLFEIARSTSKKHKVYFYKFTGQTERNFMCEILKLHELVGDKIPVIHADELNYLFPMKKANLKLEKDSKSYRIIAHITKLWTNFAKYGNPTPDNNLGFTWTPYNDGQSYLEIDEKLTMGTEPDKEEVDFWENIYKEFLPESLPY